MVAGRIAVVDYCKGNLKSVERGLRAVGGDAFITEDPARIAGASAIVLPGVGAFADAAASMEATGQMPVIRDAIDRGVPFLGICLGLHLLFEEGTEGAPEEDDEASTHNARGLAVLPGVVAHMPRVDAMGTRYKVPHVGWNSIELIGDAQSPLLEGIATGEYFYFTHSYIAPACPCAVATTTHSVTFPSAVDFRHTAFGVQFHPEKSSDAGLAVMKNFLRVVERAGL
jgi:glutamine amidotransferase